MDLEQILKLAVATQTSDVILKTGELPRLRRLGKLVPIVDGQPVSTAQMKQWVESIITQTAAQKLLQKGDVDFGYNSSFGSRFRVNVFRQRSQLGMVLRAISSKIRTLEELELPVVINNVATHKRGITLVTGATGSGKSSTLAGIIQKINTSRAAHIITIEDPIEFYYKDEVSMINQRELGEDTLSFPQALKAALRQNPDVILVGELRDAESVETALMAAETGHMVLSTLHTQDAVDSLTRIMSYFSPHQHKNIRMQLAATLNMIVSQRLVPRKEGQGMIAACEILVANAHIRDLILKGESFEPITDAIKKGGQAYSMQNFNKSLYALFESGKISQEQALNEATSKEEMKLLFSGIME